MLITVLLILVGVGFPVVIPEGVPDDRVDFRTDKWSNVPVETLRLFVPPLHQVAQVLERGLKRGFSKVSVSLVRCPDLTKPPFYLAAKGLHGRPTIIEVGDMSYLIPKAVKSKIYNLDEIARKINFPGSFMIGQGTGPFNVLGVASEFVANIRTSNGSLEDKNLSYAIFINKTTGLREMLQVPWTSDFGLLGQMFASEGSQGIVLEVRASHRTASADFLTRMREELQNQYGARIVGLGGVFLIKSGMVNISVQQDFSPVPLTLNEFNTKFWRKFNMSSPLVCSCVVESNDPGLNLTKQHSHCFSNHGDGGHYNNDVSPGDVEYLGYLSVAELLYRIDRSAAGEIKQLS